ncbi:MAG TPA: AhpC/TSA family protein [Thermoleophilaceae bacterium]
MNGAHEQIEAHGVRIVLIGQATPRHAAHYQRRFAPELEILADEKRESYKAMGFPRAGATQLIGPKSLAKGLARGATGVGVGRVIGDVQQLGGTFIVDQEGEILWSHVMQDASDNPSLEELLEALTDTVG